MLFSMGLYFVYHPQDTLRHTVLGFFSLWLCLGYYLYRRVDRWRRGPMPEGVWVLLIFTFVQLFALGLFGARVYAPRMYQPMYLGLFPFAGYALDRLVWRRLMRRR
jgi:hypothetical protein